MPSHGWQSRVKSTTAGLNAGGTVLDISDTPFVRQAGFSGKVYLGVVQNAPHPERAAAYIHYLFQR